MPCSWFLCVVVDPKGERRGWILLFLFLILVLWLWLRAFCFFETCLVCVRAREGVILLFVSRILPLLVPILFCSDPSHTAPILFEAPSFFFLLFTHTSKQEPPRICTFLQTQEGHEHDLYRPVVYLQPIVPRSPFFVSPHFFRFLFLFRIWWLFSWHNTRTKRHTQRREAPSSSFGFFFAQQPHTNRRHFLFSHTLTPPNQTFRSVFVFLCVLLSPLEQQFNPPKHKKTLAQPTNHYAQKSFFFSSRASHTQQLWKEREIRGGC